MNRLVKISENIIFQFIPLLATNKFDQKYTFKRHLKTEQFQMLDAYVFGENTYKIEKVQLHILRAQISHATELLKLVNISVF